MFNNFCPWTKLISQNLFYAFITQDNCFSWLQMENAQMFIHLFVLVMKLVFSLWIKQPQVNILVPPPHFVCLIKRR